jgi:prepilin-type N-terminal cleavage/methylation domain-containing protein
MRNYHQRRVSAFTLIELLVVIGLIGVLAAGIGLALGRGNSGTALQAGQGTLQALLSAARAQAAIKQATTDLVVDADPSSDGFLRTFYVVVNNEAVGAAISLPQGIHVVPKTTGTTYSGGVRFKKDASDTTDNPTAWNGLVSSGFDNTSVTVSNVTGTFRKVIGLTVRGTTSPAGGGNLVLSSAERDGGSTIVFNNPAAVRGADISTYGVMTLLNDADAF